jgi:hypothetical protein
MRELGTATCSARAPQPPLPPHAASDLDMPWQARDTYHVTILTENLEVTDGSKLLLPRLGSRLLIASLHDGGGPWGSSKRHRSRRPQVFSTVFLKPFGKWCIEQESSIHEDRLSSVLYTGCGSRVALVK